jgi:hypothetical protein
MKKGAFFGTLRSGSASEDNPINKINNGELGYEYVDMK